MIYLYGLMKCATNPVSSLLTGVTGPVEAVQFDRCWLVHGSAETNDILPKRRHLLAHARVLEDLMQVGTLLPMRFGMFADAVLDVAELVEHGAKAIDASFDRLTGRVEIGLRLSYPRQAALDATLTADPSLTREHARLSRLCTPQHFAVAEFGKRLAEALDDRRGAAQKRLLRSLRPHWQEYMLKTPGSDVEVLSVECLVDEGHVDDLVALVQQEARALSDFAGGAEPTVQVVGPSPAFHFVNISLGSQEPVEA